MSGAEPGIFCLPVVSFPLLFVLGMSFLTGDGKDGNDPLQESGSDMFLLSERLVAN